jgi:hypothetical protein
MSNAFLLYRLMVPVLPSARLIKCDIAAKRMRCLKRQRGVIDRAKTSTRGSRHFVKAGIQQQQEGGQITLWPICTVTQYPCAFPAKNSSKSA